MTRFHQLIRSWNLIPWLLLLAANASFAQPAPDDGLEQPPSKVADTSEPEVITIPLDQIWAYRMPGTRDVSQLETAKPSQVKYGPLVGQIRSLLSQAPPNSQSTQTGFAVLGVGLDALREAKAVLAGKRKLASVFPADSDISVVFFSHEFGPYVHLTSITLRGRVVELGYQFVPHRTEEVTANFAIIPLPKLKAGKYQVNIERQPLDRQLVKLGFAPVPDEAADQIVCHSFSFSVTDQGD